MQKVVHKSKERGVAEHGWLHSHFSFSFADWYEPTRMGFGALRVINDDIVAPASGFGMHPHRDMEIITIVNEGAVTHADSMGNQGAVVPAGDVQVMSAGTGVVHAEHNESPDVPLKLFQIWIFPKVEGVEPVYGQASFGEPLVNEIETLVAPVGEDYQLTINQDAYISRAKIEKGTSLEYEIRIPGNGVYVFAVSGEVDAEGEVLGERDALGVWDTGHVALKAISDTTLLLIEVPM